MSMHHLGEQIDIHGGGNDLIFPHHENEIAQTECATGKPFARHWVHNGMMQLAGEKMSKSVGNLVTIEDFLATHEGDVLRMMVLNSSYHNPLSFGDEIISQAEKALERLRLTLRPAVGGEREEGDAGQSVLRELMTIFGLHIERPEAGGQATPFIELLINLRRELRQQKLWALA